MRVTENPGDPPALKKLKKALGLPWRTILKRSFGLMASLPKSLAEIHRLQGLAAAQGKTLRFVVLVERMGDIIAAEPTVRKLKATDDYLVWLSRPRFSGILAFNPAVDAVVAVHSYTESVLLRRVIKDVRWTDLHVDGSQCNVFGFRTNNPTSSGINEKNYYLHGPLADVFALIGTGEKADESPRIFPDPAFDALGYLSEIFDAHEKPLLLLHLASDEAVRSWSPEEARRTADWVLRNTDFNVIEVGLSPFLQPSPRIHLLRDGLPLGRQLALFEVARIFVGVDSGFAHVANAARTPSILLLGDYRNFPGYLPCRPNEATVVLRNHDQVRCIRGSEVVEALIKLSAIKTSQG